MSSVSKRITSDQVRAARGLLNLSGSDLAKLANVGLSTIRRIEKPGGDEAAIPATLSAIRRALEDAGVEFIDANGSGPGVRLKKPST